MFGNFLICCSDSKLVRLLRRSELTDSCFRVLAMSSCSDIVLIMAWFASRSIYLRAVCMHPYVHEWMCACVLHIIWRGSVCLGLF